MDLLKFPGEIIFEICSNIRERGHILALLCTCRAMYKLRARILQAPFYKTTVICKVYNYSHAFRIDSYTDTSGFSIFINKKSKFVSKPLDKYPKGNCFLTDVHIRCIKKQMTRPYSNGSDTNFILFALTDRELTENDIGTAIWFECNLSISINLILGKILNSNHRIIYGKQIKRQQWINMYKQYIEGTLIGELYGKYIQEELNNDKHKDMFWPE